MTEVFVAAGVWASSGKDGCWIEIKEIKPAGKPSYIGMSSTYGAGLKPSEAKQLADQLYELANKAEARNK